MHVQMQMCICGIEGDLVILKQRCVFVCICVSQEAKVKSSILYHESIHGILHLFVAGDSDRPIQCYCISTILLKTAQCQGRIIDLDTSTTPHSSPYPSSDSSQHHPQCQCSVRKRWTWGVSSTSKLSVITPRERPLQATKRRGSCHPHFPTTFILCKAYD